MKSRLPIFLILALCTLSAFCGVKEDVWRFESFSSENGLSNDWVNDIAEDKRGFLWVATRSGLNTFDGSNFDKYYFDSEDENSISSNDVSCLLPFKDKIYAGTWGGGVTIIDPIKKEFSRTKQDTVLSYLAIKNMVLGPDSLIYICTYGDGVFKFDPSSESFTAIETEDSSENTQFLFVETIHCFNNQIWFGLQSRGLGRINENGLLEMVELNPTNNDSLHRVVVINDDGKDLILGTQNGEVVILSSKDYGIRKVIDLSTYKSVKTRVVSILEDKENRCWVASTSGLFLIDKTTGEKTKVIAGRSAVSYKNEFCSYQDSRGIIWFGSWGNGLKKYYKGAHKFNEINLSNFNTVTVKSIYEYNDSTLLLGSSNGIIQYNKKSNTSFKPIFKGDLGKNLSQNVISGFTSYGNKTLVAVDAVGLYLLDKDNFVTSFLPIEDEKLNYSFINNINTTYGGDIWVSTWSNGLLQIDTSTHEFIHYLHDENNNESIGCDLVHCVFRSSDGTFWVGTKEGLSSLYKSKQIFYSPELFIPETRSISAVKDIRSISEDKDGNLWLASSIGLVRWNRGKKELRLFTEKDGLIDHALLGILIEGNNLWGESKSGLVRMNLDDFSVYNYTKRDGLLSNSFVENSISLTSDSTLYLGNGHGVIYFNFNKNNEFSIGSDVFITSLNLNREQEYLDDNSKHISDLSSLTVPYNQNSLFFSVKVQDYGVRKFKIFAHKLEGFQDEWVYHQEGQNEISYTNLPPGDYVLCVSNLDKNGQISQEYKKLSIHVEKPFWLRWWFVLVVLGVLVLLLYLLFQWRSKTIRKNNTILENRVKERTSELTEKNFKLNTAYQNLKQNEEHLKDNIRYASILQDTMKPDDFELSRSLGSHFVFERSEGGVSGDFYWSIKIDSKRIVVVGDCTGGGVSGAFLSTIGITSLRSIITTRGVTKPSFILDELHKEIVSVLNVEQNELMESISLSVMCYDQQTRFLEISSANSSPVVVNDKGEHLVIKGSRFPVGGQLFGSKGNKEYKSFEIQVSGRYMVYLFTDGYQNQIGGEEDKKFLVVNLRKLLLTQYFKKTKDQKKIIEYTFEKWKGDNELTDDVLLIGLVIEG